MKSLEDQQSLWCLVEMGNRVVAHSFPRRKATCRPYITLSPRGLSLGKTTLRKSLKSCFQSPYFLIKLRFSLLIWTVRSKSTFTLEKEHHPEIKIISTTFHIRLLVNEYLPGIPGDKSIGLDHPMSKYYQAVGCGIPWFLASQRKEFSWETR